MLFKLAVAVIFLAANKLCSDAIDLNLIGKGYQKCLHSNPLLTNMVTASVLSVCSDAISQKMERNKIKIASQPSSKNKYSTQTNNIAVVIPAHNSYRSLTMAIYGALVSGMIVSLWFRFLNGLISPKDISGRGIALKVFINQLVMSPFLNTAFFSWVVFTRDFSSSFQFKLHILREKLKKDLRPTIARSLFFGTITNTVNFSNVFEAKYQVIFTNLVFLFWTAYLSFIGFRK